MNSQRDYLAANDAFTQQRASKCSRESNEKDAYERRRITQDNDG